ncbi:MAG: hypothetical protein HY259_00555 [Chloroflexi bacterium]|nr:hypothetical protein [Chloroflexota bacterium]
MYAVVNYLPLKGPLDEDVLLKLEQEFKPKALALPGLQAFYFVRAADDEAIMVIIYESLNALLEGRAQVGSPFFQKVIAPHLSGEPRRLIGKVVAHGRK